MEIIPKNSTWNLEPTDAQIRAITRLCRQRRIPEYLEERPSTRWEARNLIDELRSHNAK